MKENIIKWIWQHKDYPNFKYDKSKLTDLLTQIEYNRGQLDGISKLFNRDDITKIEIETLTDEAINTSLIEGELLKRESVRSSFKKKLDKDRFRQSLGDVVEGYEEVAQRIGVSLVDESGR